MNKVLTSVAVLGIWSLTVGAVYAETAAKPVAAKTIKVYSPYARAVPPGQMNSAIFMTLVNPTQTPFSIKAASSPAAKVTELHTTQNNNGVMEMRQVPKMDIPALGQTVLKPGSLHVMLIGLKQDLKVGEKTSVTLTFDDNSQMMFDVPIQEVVRPAGMGGGGMNHGGGHNHMH